MSEKKRGNAIIECYEQIPCNPCTAVCKTGAITMETLTSLPEYHAEKCIGCRLCVAACPGQAIYFQIEDYEEGFSTITFPYEYLPLPEKGQSVTAVSRDGERVCDGEVLSVDTVKVYNRTSLVTVKIPKQYKDEARFIKRIGKEEGAVDGR